MPKVSIIIPVYNKAQYIQKTFESIKKQGIEDYEVIAVNNCSTDDSLAILKELAAEDRRIKVFDTKKKGVSHARNVGLDVACGEWIQFLDADDYLVEGYLSQAVELAELNAADLLFSGFYKVDNNGEQLQLVEIKTPNNAVSQIELCDLFIQNQFVNGYFGFISNKLLSKDLITRASAKFPEDIILAEDLDFYAHLYPYVKIAYFWKGKSFCYRQTSENYLYNCNVDYYAQAKIILDVIKWFGKSNSYEKYKDTLDLKLSEYVYAIMFDANEKHRSLKDALQLVIQNKEMYSHVNECYFTGFKRYILKAVISRNYNYLKLLFCIRNLLRKIYRIGMRNS